MVPATAPVHANPWPGRRSLSAAVKLRRRQAFFPQGFFLPVADLAGEAVGERGGGVSGVLSAIF